MRKAIFAALLLICPPAFCQFGGGGCTAGGLVDRFSAQTIAGEKAFCSTAAFNLGFIVGVAPQNTFGTVSGGLAPTGRLYWGNKQVCDTSGNCGSGGEVDPVFSASPALGIAAGDITNWNTAYGWGNHAVAGYLLKTGGLMTGPLNTSSSVTASEFYGDGSNLTGISVNIPNGGNSGLETNVGYHASFTHIGSANINLAGGKHLIGHLSANAMLFIGGPGDMIEKIDVEIAATLDGEAPDPSTYIGYSIVKLHGALMEQDSSVTLSGLLHVDTTGITPGLHTIDFWLTNKTENQVGVGMIIAAFQWAIQGFEI